MLFLTKIGVGSELFFSFCSYAECWWLFCRNFHWALLLLHSQKIFKLYQSGLGYVQKKSNKQKKQHSYTHINSCERFDCKMAKWCANQKDDRFFFEENVTQQEVEPKSMKYILFISFEVSQLVARVLLRKRYYAHRTGSTT